MERCLVLTEHELSVDRIPTTIFSCSVRGEDGETISAVEIAEREAAWQDYLAERDPGISLAELEVELFGKELDESATTENS